MSNQLDDLRAAVKAVAKARAEGKPIDLSNLPAPLRQKLEAQLAKLPPETRQQLKATGIAAVDEAAKRVAGANASPMRHIELPKYRGHYNATVQAGDATHVPWFWLFAVVAIAVVIGKYVI